VSGGPGHDHGGDSGRSGGGHAHGGAGADVRALRIALGLIVGFMVIEVVVAVLAGSLALLADAGHMLTDAAALATELSAIRLAARPVTATWSFDLKREVGGPAVLVVALVGVFVTWRPHG
jgi:cobalt-zinc-cadmium efflux system protein